jgi:hypothetical protein
MLGRFSHHRRPSPVSFDSFDAFGRWVITTDKVIACSILLVLTDWKFGINAKNRSRSND